MKINKDMIKVSQQTKDEWHDILIVCGGITLVSFATVLFEVANLM